MLIVKAEEGNGVIAFALFAGDHELNNVKAEKIDRSSKSSHICHRTRDNGGLLNSAPGFIGPLNLNCRIVARPCCC